jgi:DNA-binding NarL/FixJ family response regulator
MRIVGREESSSNLNEPAGPMRLLVVDSAPVLLEGLTALLGRQPEFEVFAAPDTKTLPPLSKSIPIELAIVDIASRTHDGWSDVRRIQEKMPAVRIVVMDETPHEYQHRRATRRQLSGLIVKHDPIRNLTETLLSTRSGGFAVSASVLECGRLTGRSSAVGLHLLTEREVDILRLIGDGWSMRSIAERLHISENTIDNHKTRILRKLGMHRIVDLVRFAIGMGLSVVDSRNCLPPASESESA